MKKNEYFILHKDDLKKLYDTICYMKMAELKQICQDFSLLDSGKKHELIKRIMFFIETGTALKEKKIPDISLAKNYPKQTISKNSLMLYGSYKNNAETRSFFKKLIGPHFHFTAFGIDWLNSRWLEGKPPTYQEFANYWIYETVRRKNNVEKPKIEWAYLNFIKKFNKSNPGATKENLLSAWRTERAEKVKIAKEIIKKVKNNRL